MDQNKNLMKHSRGSFPYFSYFFVSESKPIAPLAIVAGKSRKLERL